MADLFVSYARKDKAFAHALCEALRQRSRDVWIDWEDIPPTSTWLDEVFAGIESSHAFVAIITPDLAASRVCGLELARAVEHGKRLVPIVHREVDENTLQPALRTTDWIWFRETDDGEQATALLEKALDTDLEWLHAHTRLTMRAGDWKARLRNRSLLLRGHDLDDAQRWLSAAPTRKSPEATTLQREYVAASRASQTRFRRIVSGGVTVVVLIAAVLGIAAWFQNQLGTSRALAGAATSHISADPELALLLASEAGHVWRTRQAEAALRRTLLASHGRKTLRAHEGAVSTAAFSPDDTQLLSTSEDGTARLWKLGSADPPLVLWRSRFAPVAAFSPDGRSVVTAGDDGSVRLWSAEDGSSRGIWAHGSAIESAAFDASGRHLLTRDAERAIQVWNVDAGSVLWTANDPGFESAAFSPDGLRVVASGQEDVIVWDLATGKETLRLPPHPWTVLTAVFSPDGAAILSSWELGEVRLWDAQSGKSRATLSGHEDPVDRIVADPSGRRVATSTHWVHTESGGGPSAIGDKTIRVWSVSDGGAQSVLRGHSRQINAIAFTKDGELLVSASDDQTSRVWDPETGRALRVLRGHVGSVRSAAFSHDGTLVVTAGDDRTVRLWESGLGSSVASGRSIRPEWRDYGRFSASGKFVTVSAADGRSSVAEVETGQSIPFPPAANEDGVRAELSPDRKWMVTTTGAAATASGGEKVKVFDVETGTQRFVLSHDAPVYSARFDAAAARVITAGEDATARIWAMSDGHEVASLAHRDRVLDAVFSHGGDRVATASRDTTAVVWNAASGARLAELRGHEDSVLTAEFSPDDRLVATVGADNTVRLWEPSTGEELAVFGWRDVTPLSVAFSSDCHWLTIETDADRARRFPCNACGDVDGLRAVAGTRTERQLTRDDVRAALGR